MPKKKKRICHISQRLQKVRHESGWTQEKIANALSVSLNTYASLESYPPGFESENRLQTLLLKGNFKESSYEPSYEPVKNARGEYVYNYAAQLSKIFNVPYNDFLHLIGLPSLDDSDLPESIADIVDDGFHASDETYGFHVPVGQRHTIHGAASLPLRIRKENEAADRLALGVLSLPPNLNMGEGSFAYVWTAEFANSRDGFNVGELIFIDARNEQCSLVENEFYVLLDCGHLFLRRAGRQGKNWYFASDHWYDKECPLLIARKRDSRVYGRVYRFSTLMQEYLQPKELQVNDDKDSKKRER